MTYQWIRSLFGRRPAAEAGLTGPPPEPTIPDGHRIYAVGDIHGRADLLRQLQSQIAEDAAHAPTDLEKTIIYLGDYVDRGLDTKGVIDLLLQDPPEGLAAMHLMGNHEETMLRFLTDASVGPFWFAIGGDATAYSYGIGLPKGLSQEARFNHVWHELQRHLPAAHLAFLSGLKLSHAVGDYAFVHAGVRPGVPLEDQRREDLLWIRDQFLGAEGGWDKVIVHGHSATHRPESLPHRIGVDTGAYATNVLSCLVLEGRERRFLSTKR